MLADNRFLTPTPLDTVMEKDEAYRTAVVVGGIQLVPDP